MTSRRSSVPLVLLASMVLFAPTAPAQDGRPTGLDRVFNETLLADWVDVESLEPESGDPRPKPIEQPEAPGETNPRPVEITPDGEAVVSLTPDPGRPEPFIDPDARASADRSSFSFSFFDKTLGWPYVSPLVMPVTRFAGKEEIARTWDLCAAWPHHGLINRVSELARDHDLNDWSVFLLANSIASRMPGLKGEQQQTFLTWFLMTKLGYGLKVAFAANDLLLLVPVREKLFAVTYYRMGDGTYYLFRGSRHLNSVPTIRTFPGSYAERSRGLSLRLTRPPSFNRRTRARTVLDLQVSVSDDVLIYGNSQPMTELSIYFSTPMSRPLRASLETRFSPGNGTPEQHLNAALDFIQRGLGYQTDQQQFGRERPLYADEAIHYPYADCEDRSILFARIMRDLHGYEVIGLKYPGHVAVGVSLPERIRGDAVLFDRRYYVICDPTYIGAKAGVSMPRFADTTPDVIEVR